MAIADITKVASTNWSAKLGSFGEIVTDYEDIDQCIRIILLTPKGSDPHRPTFASDLGTLIDAKQTGLKPRIIKECYQSILAWEPRIDILGVEVNFGVDDLASVEVQIRWKLKTAIAPQLTVIAV